MNFSKVIMDVKDTAKMLGVSETHIEGLCKNSRLRGAKKKGGRWAISLAAIREYQRGQPSKVLVDMPLLYRLRDYLLIYYQFCGQEGLLIAQRLHALKSRKRCDRSEISRLENKLCGMVSYQSRVWDDFEKIETELLLGKQNSTGQVNGGQNAKG